MRSGLLRQRGAADADRHRGQEQLRLRRHQRHAGVQAGLTLTSDVPSREAPPVEAIVTRFGAWRFTFAVLSAAGVSVPWWWLFDRAIFPAPSEWLVALVTTVILLLSTSSLRRENRAFALRWDTRSWSVASSIAGKAHRSPVTRAEGEAVGALRFVDGDMSVVIDLGSWLLLRFDSVPFHPNLETATATTDVNLQTPRRASRHMTQRLWLPVQKAGLEPQWLALRRALNSRASRDSEASRSLQSSSFA